MADDFVYTGPELPIEYVAGAGPDFVVYINSLGEAAQLHSIKGYARWIVTREDGSKYIARPIEAKP